MTECPLVEPAIKRRATILESFNKRMKILAFMIQIGRAVTPTEIKEGTGIDYYNIIGYHLNCLRKEGVVILMQNSENMYKVQPMLCEAGFVAKFNEMLKGALPAIKLNKYEVEGDMVDAKVSALTNSMLYYIKYLSESGQLN